VHQIGAGARLPSGLFFFHRLYEGAKETKDRYFIVVATTEVSFLCFTTSAQPYLLKRFAEHVVHVPLGTSCLPKECVVDCRNVCSFGDIELNSKLNSGTVAVYGDIDDALLLRIAQRVKVAKLLDRGVRRHIVETLSSILGIEL
jgi:hypothetical protein